MSDKLKASDKLKTKYEKLDPREALQSSTDILLGITSDAVAALKLIEIESVFDLATSSVFAAANKLLKAGLDPKDIYFRFGSPPKDIIHESATNSRVDELRFSGIEILEGISPSEAKTISEALDVKTVRDLALWPPFLAAHQILMNAYFPEMEICFNSEAPADLLPKSGEYPTERVFYNTLTLDQVESEPRMEIEQSGPIDIAPTLDQSFGFKNIGIGALITMSQSWYAQGVALGQLLHSTALAPGESTRIAMLDWSRRTKAGTTETISEQEELENNTMHGRSLSEVTKAVANEAQNGFSSTNNTTISQQKGKSTGGVSLDGDVLNALTGGIFGDDPGVNTSGTTSSESTVTTSGMTFTSSSGRRDLEASMTQNVLDKTHQYANSVRNRRASIVREVSQEEHQSVSTRVVTNYNHMHALSIQYYEIVQIYRVEVGISDVEKCIFVPMKLVDFTQAVIDKYRLVLARSAVDHKAYDLLTRRYGVVEIIPQTPRITPNKLLLANTVLRDKLYTLVKDNQITSQIADSLKEVESNDIKENLNTRPTLLDVLAVKGYDLAQLDNAAKIFGKGVVLPNSDSIFLSDDTVITGLLVRDGSVTKIEAKVRGENTKIGLGTDGVSLSRTLPITEIESIHIVSGKKEEQTITLVLQCNYLGAVFPLSIKIRLVGGNETQEVIHFGAVRANKELIEHLNANKLHYSQAIYRSLDASNLALLLSPYSYRGKPLVQLIDPTPVTISGNYLVFKMHASDFDVDADGRETLSEWGQWLKDHGIDKTHFKTDLIPLPSGGVFAEAVLGRYNAAEKLDMTRFWNWQDSPIPIVAPEIAPVEMNSRGTTEELKPGQLGAPVVSIVNPTSLPDPTSLATVLQAIQNGNMFRDMSGIAATMGLAQAGITAASQGATNAGAQAGTNMATTTKFVSDMVKTAASLAAMGIGGPLGGAAAGGVLGSIGSSGGNISNAGAMINQGRSMAERATSGNTTNNVSDTSKPGGIQENGGVGGMQPNLSNNSSSGSVGSDDFEAQAFNRALWGTAGSSQGEIIKTLNSDSPNMSPFFPLPPPVPPETFDFEVKKGGLWMETKCLQFGFVYKYFGIDIKIPMIVGTPTSTTYMGKISIPFAQKTAADAAWSTANEFLEALNIGMRIPNLEQWFRYTMQKKIEAVIYSARVNGCSGGFSSGGKKVVFEVDGGNLKVRSDFSSEV
ncbi:hypothetical protein [Bacillus tropicus]|uniref:hypothetical protein n=1 Tax=Bacillus tropicus TaxID=2026188 RepID=UPI003EDB5584